MRLLLGAALAQRGLECRFPRELGVRRQNGTESRLQLIPIYSETPEFRVHGIGLDLDAADVGFAGELFFHGVAVAEGHGDELPDEPFADGKAVEPRLLRETT